MTNGTATSGLYRSRNGMILGVFRGLGEYLDFPVFWLRVGGVLLCLFTGFWPMVLIYIIAGLLMKLKPVVPFSSDADREFYDSYAGTGPGTGSRSRAVSRLKRKFDNLNRRIQRMEHIVTSKDFDWKRRFTE